MATREPSPSERLLAEGAWLQRLALRLAAEPAGALDAVQETLLRALERPPATSVPARAWLAAVLRNTLRQSRRARLRRETRERARPLPEEGEPADALSLRLELHERLLAEVRALEEPYRTTVVLRFLEERSPREIAAQLGVPPKTVHTRLERALVRLRARLDDGAGGRTAWTRALLLSPLARAPRGSTLTPLTPVLTMGTIAKWTAAAVTVAALGWLAVREPEAPSAPSPVAHPVATAARTVPAPPAATDEPREPEGSGREAIPSAPRAGSVARAPEAPPEAPRFHGSVERIDGSPVAGIAVHFEPEPGQGEPGASVASAADGGFTLAVPEVRGRILARGAGLATVFAPALAGGMPLEPPIVIVGPEESYAGLVRTPDGTGLSEVELSLRLPETALERIGLGSLPGMVPVERVRSDADGRFAFPPLGFVPGLKLVGERQGFAPARLELPASSRADLELVMGALEARILAGKVLGTDGTPVAGARVSAGGTSVRSLADGSFALELGPGERPRRLVAIDDGLLPAELELEGLPESALGGLVLVLGPPALTIEGRVVDARGRALAGVEVWTLAGEPFGELVERLAGLELSRPVDQEEVIAGSGRDGRATRTDGAGRFMLRGLVARSYGLQAMHPETLELSRPIEVAAGRREVTLVLGDGATRRVSGRVTTLAGAPVAGAKVRPRPLARHPDGALVARDPDPIRSAETDAEGRYRFEALTSEPIDLLLSEVPSPQTRRLEAGSADLEDVDFRVPARCLLRLALADPTRADSFGLEDAAGNALSFSFQVGLETFASTRIGMGRASGVIQTDESARWLVLWKGNAVSERIPLALRPGVVTEVGDS